jgi:hypothetical protein
MCFFRIIGLLSHSSIYLYSVWLNSIQRNHLREPGLIKKFDQVRNTPLSNTAIFKWGNLYKEKVILNLGVCILLRVSDQVQGFPSNATTFQWLFTILFKLSATCFGHMTIVKSLNSFPAFFGTQRFITACTRALHLSLSWARPIQSKSPTYRLSKIHPNIIHSLMSWSS